MESWRRRETGTFCPYLRYRKREGKNDEEQESPADYGSESRLCPASRQWTEIRGMETRDPGPLPNQKLLIIQTFDSLFESIIARWRPSGEGKPHVWVD